MNILSKSLSIPSSFYPFFIGLWPPLWFTGISFGDISPDFRSLTVRMAFRFYNKNILGIQYGGNLFSMTDPCYLMMLSKNLGPNYKVIDKAASIDFLQPGMGPVSAHCQLTQQDIDEIISATANGNRYLKTFEIDIINDNDTLIAKVSRVVYIRKKPH